MSTMPVSQRQMVEIAKAVSFNSKIIVFDEPTSSLTEEEVEHLFRIINMLRDRGCGIIYISHKMAEIKRISDEITIMRDGTWVATEPADDLSMDDIIRLMVGRELTNQFPPKTNKPGEVALEVEHLTAQYSLLKDVSFNVRKGEIYQLILDLANKDKVVMVVSSEMPELLGICDRILVMSGGRLAGEVDAKTATQEEIMTLAAKYV